MAPADTPVTEALEQLDIPHRLHRHNRPVRSLEEAAARRGLDPTQIVRSLLFRLEVGEYLLLLMPGPEQVNWRKLRQHLGVSRITTASAEEVRAVTGFEPGALSPFGLRQPLRLLADNSLPSLEEISIGAGERNAGIILRSKDLIGTLEIEFGDFRDE